MTVAAKNPLELYAGDGVSTAFAARWRYLSTASLLVEKIDAVGVATTLQLGVDYSATAGATDAGGMVTLNTAPSADEFIRIRRVTPQAQQTDYPPSGNFPAESHELALDRQMMIAQEQREGLNDLWARALQVPFGEIAPELPAAASRTGKFLAFDALGKPYATAGTGEDGAVRVDLASATPGKGAALVRYKDRTVEAKLDDLPYVTDFDGVVADGINNDTAGINAAVAEKLHLRWRAGTYLVDSLPTPAAGAIWIAEGLVIIKRRATSTANAILTVSNPSSIQGFSFDGNKAANSNACNCVVVTAPASKFDRCTFINAKAVAGGFGSGLVYAEAASSADSDHSLWDCYAYSNDADGFNGQNVRGLEAIGNTAHDNVGCGFQFNNYDVALTKKLYDCRVIGNYAYENGQTGIYFGNFVESNDFLDPDFGPANLEGYRIIISNNICNNNGFYGIAAQGDDIVVEGNVCYQNAAVTAAAGGILLNAVRSKVANNVCHGNLGFGLDAGGSQYSSVNDNQIWGNTGTGLNIGATVNCSASGNHIMGNGGTYGVQVDVHSVDTDANYIAFSELTQSLSICGNQIVLTLPTQYGVYLHDGAQNVSVVDNDFFGTDATKFIVAIAFRPTIKGNRIPVGISRELAVGGGGAVSIPDVLEFGFTNSGTTVTSLDFHSAQSVVTRTGIGWVNVTAQGSGYTSAPTVVFTGGGGTGAAATAHIRAGKVIGIRMTNHGTGYTSAPSISFTGGGGSGATGAAQLSVPLGDWREFELYTTQACTINRLGPPVVESKGAANLTMGARDAARLRSFFGQWSVLGRAA